jgi:ABC-type nitrate/sulfonate/bicarbonate transport system substrate-binding protein
MVPSLATGRLDAGHGSTSPGFFNAILSGVGVKIVSDVTILRVPGPNVRNSLQLVVRRELADQVRGLADLKGRIIGINQRGTVNHGQLEKMLGDVGLTLDDVQIETIPFPDQMSALANGAVDAAVMIEPFLAIALDRGVATVIMDMGEGTPGWPVQVLFYGPEFLKDQTDVGKRFMVAYVKALRYIEAAYRQGANRDEVFQILIDNTQLKDMALWQRMSPTYSETNGAVNTRAIEADQDFYVRQGLQRERIDVRTIVDPSFAQYAVQVLGRSAE